VIDTGAAWLRRYYAPTGHVARGAEEARTFVRGALKVAPGASYEVISALFDGEQFAAEWVMRPAGLHGASVGTVRGGKVLTNRDFGDASPPSK
jgi:hypothetical protein